MRHAIQSGPIHDTADYRCQLFVENTIVWFTRIHDCKNLTELIWVRDQTWRMRRCRLRYGGGHLAVVFGSTLKLVRKAVLASWLTGCCCWWWVSSHISLLPLLQLTAPTLHQQLVFAHPDNYKQKKNYQFIFNGQIRNRLCKVIVGCFIYLVLQYFRFGSKKCKDKCCLHWKVMNFGKING